MTRRALCSLLLLLACNGPRDRGGGGNTVVRPRPDAGGACVAECAGKACGDDGCGGSCGTCPQGAPFCVGGLCQVDCAADCAGKECGDDGCGGSCGSCPMAAPLCVQSLCMAACTPDCTGKTCGDDGCGGSCGTCDAGCTAGETRCTDGFAYEVCGLESPEATTRTFGPRIPCWEGAACNGGTCTGICGTPELIVIVDRSSSMLGARWTFVRDAITSFGRRNPHRAAYQVRLFPYGSGCGPSVAFPVESGLELGTWLEEPTTDSQTPIAAALSGLPYRFGDPNQGQAVVLITDGDETCADDPNQAVTEAEMLRRSGIQVFVIAVSQAANPTRMAAIAQAGGTGTPFMVGDRRTLEDALDAILTTLGACGQPLLRIGDPCAADAECAGERCVTEEYFPPPNTSWPGGYCTQSCRDDPCPVGTACANRPEFAFIFCLVSCQSAADCRSSYQCALFNQTEQGCIPQ